jgi:hypothetical protein
MKTLGYKVSEIISSYQRLQASSTSVIFSINNKYKLNSKTLDIAYLTVVYLQPLSLGNLLVT